MTKKRLYKSRKNKMVGGVCGGLAEYLNMDPTIVRIIAGVLCLVKGIGLLVYLIACIVMPYDDELFEDPIYIMKNGNVTGITVEEMKKMLKRYGRLSTTAIPYNAFRGSRNLSGRDIHVREYLFALKKD
jgi:phage shock protein C